jgi:hypothetical protein
MVRENHGVNQAKCQHRRGPEGESGFVIHRRAKVASTTGIHKPEAQAKDLSVGKDPSLALQAFEGTTWPSKVDEALAFCTSDCPVRDDP